MFSFAKLLWAPEPLNCAPIKLYRGFPVVQQLISIFAALRSLEKQYVGREQQIQIVGR